MKIQFIPSTHRLRIVDLPVNTLFRYDTHIYQKLDTESSICTQIHTSERRYCAFNCHTGRVHHFCDELPSEVLGVVEYIA